VIDIDAKIQFNENELQFYRSNGILFNRFGRSNGSLFIADGGLSNDADDQKSEARGGFFFQADSNDDTIADNLVHPLELWCFNGTGTATNQLRFRIRLNKTIDTDGINELTAANGVLIDSTRVKDGGVECSATGTIKVNTITEVTANAGVTLSTHLNVRAQSADPTAPVAGSLFYDTDINKLKMFNGAAWETVTSV
jgi:hypothetical protein